MSRSKKLTVRNPEDQYTDNKWNIMGSKEERALQPKGKYKVPYENVTKDEVISYFSKLGEECNVIGSERLQLYLISYGGAYMMPKPDMEYLDCELLRNYYISEKEFWDWIEKYSDDFSRACKRSIIKVSSKNGITAYEGANKFKKNIPSQANFIAFERALEKAKDRKFCTVKVKADKYGAFIKSLSRSFPEESFPVIICSGIQSEEARFTLEFTSTGYGVLTLVQCLKWEHIDFELELLKN